MKREKVSVIGYSSDNKIEKIVEKTEEKRIGINQEKEWYDLFQRDFDKEKTDEKPTPMLWSYFYLSNIKFDEKRGKNFAKKLREEFQNNASDSFSSTQLIILENNFLASKKQIKLQKRLMKESQYEDNEGGGEGGEEGKKEEEQKIIPFYEQRSVIHFTVLTDETRLVSYLIECTPVEKRDSLINAKDFITGFTPLHYAFLTENIEKIWEVIKLGGNINRKDNYFATPLHYAKLTQRIPSKSNSLTKIKFVENNKIVTISTEKFNELTKSNFANKVFCDNDYIEELMFSSLSIENPDMEWRQKYCKYLGENDVSLENIIMCHINEKVGYGVFAAVDFKEGDFIVKYCGKLEKVIFGNKKEEENYCMSTTIWDFYINAKNHRNLGGMINHSKNPNAQAECVFYEGYEHAAIIATKTIKKGEQIFINYSDTFWKSDDKKPNEEGMNEEDMDEEMIEGDDGYENEVGNGQKLSGELDELFDAGEDEEENNDVGRNDIEEMSIAKGFPARLDFQF